ncbi:MAG: glycosyltransferase family 2 protein [Patescibacteria group bacterium]|jgi:glycosyltransferase involved in cell wall biosynthesis
MRFSLVIPAYNESSSLNSAISPLMDEIEKVETDFEIILVDNGSTDDTRERLAGLEKIFPRLKTVRVFPNQGYGNGILAGLKSARGEIIGWTHADNQIAPADIVRAYQKMLNENLQLCKAVRKERESGWRRTQSRAYNFIFHRLFKSGLRDINSPPKIFSRSLYEKINLCSLGWFIDPELVIKALREGAKIGEVEISWKPREGSRSKVSLTASLDFLFNMIKYRLNFD